MIIKTAASIASGCFFVKRKPRSLSVVQKRITGERVKTKGIRLGEAYACRDRRPRPIRPHGFILYPDLTACTIFALALHKSTVGATIGRPKTNAPSSPPPRVSFLSEAEGRGGQNKDVFFLSVSRPCVATRHRNMPFSQAKMPWPRLECG